MGTEITPSNREVFVGGHVNTVVRLSKGLSSLDWEVHIVTTPSRFNRSIRSEFDFPWAKIHLVEVDGKYGSLGYGANFLIKTARAIEVLNRSESFDIIHTHSGFFGIAVIPILIKKKLGIPAIHSAYCPSSLFPVGVPLDKSLIRILSSGLNRIIAVSNNVKNSLLSCGINEAKIEMIPLCVDMDSLNASVSNVEKPEFMTEKFETQRISFVGNISKIKGLDIFLEAAELILREYRKAEFVIALHESRGAIKEVGAMASARLDSHVEVRGIVRNMPGLLASSDVVVIPFRSTRNVSDIPLIALEAMAVGRPVIASRVGGIGELIRNGENGILLQQNHADVLANTIVSLLKNPSLKKKIGKRAISTINRRFSHIEASRKLNNLYQKALRDSR